MTPAQRQANYRKRQEEKVRRYEEALQAIVAMPPISSLQMIAFDLAQEALCPSGDARNDILG